MQKGITPDKSLEIAKEIRKEFPKTPIVLMTYSNILNKAGFSKFIKKGKKCIMEKIKIIFPEFNETVSVELDDSQSPKTVKAILENLPIEVNINKCSEDIIVITIIITQFLILWCMIVNVFFV